MFSGYVSNWSMVTRGTTKHIVGTVVDHPRFDDGSVITTSPVVRVDTDVKAAKGVVVQTRSGSIYILK